jgi:hypothetical protein
MPLSNPATKLKRAGFDVVEDASVALKPLAPDNEGDEIGIFRFSETGIFR